MPRSRQEKRYDVIVAGGGPAGIGAAIAAGRAAARTLLIEKNPFAGGTWTAGSMNVVFDHARKPGIMAEIRDRLVKAGAWAAWPGPSDRPAAPAVFAVEPMKLLLDDMLEQAGVTVRYHTLLQEVHRDGRRVTGVSTASKSGRETWEGKVFVDATGDGDLGAWAGCGFEKGRPEDGKMQPGTMFGLVGGWSSPIPGAKEMLALFRDGKFELSYDRVTTFEPPGQKGVAYFMATHLCGVDPTDADSLSRAEIQGRREVTRAIRFLRDSGDARFRNLYVIGSGPLLALREGRRIHGLYTITAEDLRAGRKFEDGVCQVFFNIDVHHVDPKEGRGLTGEPVPPYFIPYRSLVAKDVDNLLLAGRCISGDFIAHASYRVTGNCVAIGQAAGTAAAVAAKEGIAASKVDPARVSQIPAPSA